MKKIAFTAIAVLTMTAASAMAEQRTTVTTNNDGTITTTTTRYYYDQDLNNNGILDSQEFPGYVYRRWDRDGDGFLSDEEWQLSSGRWYSSPSTYRTYTAWDKNGDGRLDSTEFDVVVRDTKLYSTWDIDADNIITGDEYASATFHLYDLDGDGEISMQEWKNAQ